MITPYLEPGGKDFAKRFVLEWLEQTGGSNIKIIESATGIPVTILKALLNELMFEGYVTYEKCYRGVEVWRMEVEKK